MKYKTGQRLKYTGSENYIIEVLNYDEHGREEYTCKVCEGSQDRVGILWYKGELYLDENYKVIEKEPYTEQKSKLVL